MMQQAKRMWSKKEYFGLTTAAWIFVAVVVLLQIILRVWFLQDHIFFHAEQVRDFFVVWNAWQNHEWITLGPIQADTNGVHLGPGYYYLLLVFALPFSFAPIAGPVMASVLFVAAWAVVFWFLATRYNLTLAVIFGLLLVLSENYFLYSSYALNMNVVFLFEALLIIGLMEYVRVRSHLWLAAAGMGFVILLHLHLSAYVLLPIIMLWFVYHRKVVFADKQIWKPLTVIFGFLIVSYLPLIISEFHTNFQETRTLFNFVFVQQELSNPVYNAAARAQERGVSFYPFIWLQTFGVWIYASTFSHYYYQLFTALPYIKEVIALVGVVCVLAVTVWGVLRRELVWKVLRQWEAMSYGAFSFISVFVFLLITAAAKVHSTSVRHYIMIFFVPLLILAIIATKFWLSKKIWQRGLVVAAFIGFAVLNMWNASVDMRIQQQFPINEPYEGFSSNYNEQRSVAQKIEDALQVEIAANPSWVYEVRGPKERKGLRDVMSYLLTQTDKKNVPVNRSCGKRCKKEQANRVIIVDYGHQVVTGPELLLQDGKYAVYLLHQGKVKAFEKQLQQ